MIYFLFAGMYSLTHITTIWWFIFRRKMQLSFENWNQLLAIFIQKVANSVLFKVSHHLLNFHSQEISALTNQFPAPTVQEQQFSGGNSKVSVPSVSNMEYSTPSESAPMLDAMETGINSPVSAFRPIVNEMPNTSEERTLSPPQCRSEYSLANCIAWFCYGMFGN